ncbi:MAG: class I SAM-dependent methyltransferase [Candidatus Sumerlaeia bacterium]
MSRLSAQEDAYGQAIHDHYHGRDAYEICERDDGFVSPSGGPENYLAKYAVWPDYQRKALRFARGRCLDVGSGAGRVALHLQEKGHDVLALDISPKALKVCRERGVRNTCEMPITMLSNKQGVFDTIIMYGNNFGLFGNYRRAKWLLRKMHRLTSDQGRIIAESLDPYQTHDPVHLKFQQWNRKRGRMGGQIRLRIRYKTFCTPWFDYLLASEEEVRDIVEDTGWRFARKFEGPDNTGYAMLLEKE